MKKIIKKIISLSLMIIMISGFVIMKPVQASQTDESTLPQGDTNAIVTEAYKHLGKPYVWAGKGPNNFDCSGFTSYVYRVVTGIEIGSSTYTQIEQ